MGAEAPPQAKRPRGVKVWLVWGRGGWEAAAPGAGRAGGAGSAGAAGERGLLGAARGWDGVLRQGVGQDECWDLGRAGCWDGVLGQAGCWGTGQGPGSSSTELGQGAGYWGRVLGA